MSDRAAAIDIGTNSVLLLIAERRAASIVALDERATITRLGEGVDRTRRLKPEAAQRTLDCLARYAESIQSAQVERLDVVGTSALRDAEGGESFLDSAQNLLGVRPRIISGDEEARLTFAGALSGLGLTGAVAVFDIGGGSTEIISGQVSADAARVSSMRSLDIGSVRLHERHVAHDPPAPSELERVRGDVREALNALPPPVAISQLVGVAGTVTTLAAMHERLARYDGARVHGSRLPALVVAELVQRLAGLTVAERQALPGLDARRADVILAGAIIAEEILRWAKAPLCVVSDRGVRWGLIRDILTEPTAPRGS